MHCLGYRGWLLPHGGAITGRRFRLVLVSLGARSLPQAPVWGAAVWWVGDFRGGRHAEVRLGWYWDGAGDMVSVTVEEWKHAKSAIVHNSFSY